MTGQIDSKASSEHHATDMTVQTMQKNNPSLSALPPRFPNSAFGSDAWMMHRMNEFNMGCVDMLRVSAPSARTMHHTDTIATPRWKPSEAKPPTDPCMPKRACTSFILFANAERASVKCEHPNASAVELLRRLGEMWRSASADTKSKYTTLYLDNKAKADHARRVYATEAMPSSVHVRMSESKPTARALSNKGSKPSKAKPPTDSRMPKRACSSYILFSNAERANVKREHPSATPVEMFKRLGEKWRAADADTKAKYAAMYLECKAKHSRLASRVYTPDDVASPDTPHIASHAPTVSRTTKGETPDETTSLPDDDGAVGQWCDGYSRAVPNTPGTTDYPLILWKRSV